MFVRLHANPTYTGYLISLIYFVMLVSWLIHGTTRTHLKRLDIGCRNYFLTLENTQDDIVLSGEVWLDETFYFVISEDIVHNEDGSKLRGLSNNQICIGVATDKKQTIFLVEGTGKPPQKKTYYTFRSHIKPKSKLIHDKETAHKKLVKELDLDSIAYESNNLRGLPDKDNPMYRVNRTHAILKMFLNSHSGFRREDIQGYLNLFALVTNPPDDMLVKVESVVDLAFQNPKTLRYRKFYGIDNGF